MHHQHQTQTQSSNIEIISKYNHSKPLMPIFCPSNWLDGTVELDLSNSLHNSEQNESIPSSSKFSSFASPIHFLLNATRSHDGSCNCGRPDILSSCSSFSALQQYFLVAQNSSNESSNRCVISKHTRVNDLWTMKIQCLHCIVTNARHGPLMLLYYGLQILILFNLLPLTSCLNPPIPTHIGCMEAGADPSEAGRGDHESLKIEFECDVRVSKKLTPPNTSNGSESTASPRDCPRLVDSAAKVEMSATSFDGDSEVSSLTSDGSIPPWSFEQVGKSLLVTNDVEERSISTDDATIPSWSFVHLGESLYTSDISIEEEEETDNTTHASYDSSIPALSYVRVGGAL